MDFILERVAVITSYVFMTNYLKEGKRAGQLLHGVAIG